MTEGTTDEAKLIDAIKANAREFFPNGECTVHHDDTDDRWVLLVNHDGLTNRFTSKTIAGLLTKAENLLEYEDEQDEWEMRQLSRKRGR